MASKACHGASWGRGLIEDSTMEKVTGCGWRGTPTGVHQGAVLHFPLAGRKFLTKTELLCLQRGSNSLTRKVGKHKFSQLSSQGWSTCRRLRFHSQFKVGTLKGMWKGEVGSDAQDTGADLNSRREGRRLHNRRFKKQGNKGGQISQDQVFIGLRIHWWPELESCYNSLLWVLMGM